MRIRHSVRISSLVLTVPLALSLDACGGAEPVVAPVAAPTHAEAAKPSARDPSCKEAILQKHPGSAAICAKECNEGSRPTDAQAGSCLEVAKLDLAGSLTEVGGIKMADWDAVARALPYLEKACMAGTKEACWLGSEAIKFAVIPDPRLRYSEGVRAAKLAETGCLGDVSTDSDSDSDFAKKCCAAQCEWLDASGNLPDLRNASLCFERMCRHGYEPACASQAKVDKVIKSVMAP